MKTRTRLAMLLSAMHDTDPDRPMTQEEALETRRALDEIKDTGNDVVVALILLSAMIFTGLALTYLVRAFA